MKNYKNPERCFNQYKSVLQEIKNLKTIRQNTNNPLINLGKMLPEQPPTLYFFESPIKLLIFIFNVTLFPFVLIASTTLLFLLNIIKEVSKSIQQLENKPIETIYFTHLIRDDKNTLDKDTFLSAISQRSFMSEMSITIYFPQFSSNRFKKSDGNPLNNQILNRSVNILKFLRIQLLNNTEALNILITAFIFRKLTFNARLFLCMAAIRQLHRDCIYDQIIANQCVDYVEFYRPKSFIITYEGHGFESTTIKKLQYDFPSLKIFAYQHAPIVNSQECFFQGLKLFTGNTTLLTSGEIPRQIVLARLPNIEQNVMVLGSEKYLLEKNRDLYLHNHSNPKALLAPEASPGAVNELLQCSRDISEKFRFYDVIRLHPRLHHRNLDPELRRDLEKVEISSTKSLITELSCSKVCFYRSSAVGIQAMQFQVIPIYVSKFPNTLLDPLYLVFELSNSYNFQASIIQNLEKEVFELENIDVLQKIFNIGIQYFSEIDDDVLNWISN